jgi:DNA recombination protein RmuC
MNPLLPWLIAVAVVAVGVALLWWRAVRHGQAAGTAVATSAAEIAGLRASLAAAQDALAERGQRLEAAVADATAVRVALVDAQGMHIRLEARLAHEAAVTAERSQAQAQAHATLADQLRALGRQLYAEQGQALLGDGRTQIEGVLAPLRERLTALQQRIDAVHGQDTRDRAALSAEVRALGEAQARLSFEAGRLAKALRADTRTQGAWGELTLHRLLEAGQLEQGIAYDLQVTVRTDTGGTGRPDAILYLPGRRALAIDAKVSLTAYLRAADAADDTERAAALAEHVTSVRTHVRALGDRQYPQAIQASLGNHTLDLTILFLPSESAFAAAVTTEPELWAEAWRQGVLIVSPTTLLATLRVLARVWQHERQHQNAEQIAIEAGAMLDKFRSVLEDLDAVVKAVGQASAAIDQARSRLASGRGNVLARAAKLAQLGAQVKPETAARLAGADDPA